MADDIFTLDADNNAAVRTVNVKAGASETNSPIIFTTDENGNAAVRVVGGGDQSNLGYFATPEALSEAYPTAEAGNWAIVGSTDTVWIWDADSGESGAWVDSDRKGQVTSVNNQTGAVTVQETLVNQTNIKSINGNSLLGSGDLELSTYLPFAAGWTTNGTTKALCDDIAADTSTVKGKAYLGEVTCSDLPASMLNAEIVVEIIDGTTSSNKVIKLTCSSGNTAPYMWIYTYWNGGSDVSGWVVPGIDLPSQSGQSGKFLTTDGTDASWGDIAKVNTTVTLATADWSGSSQTVSVTGMTSTAIVFVAPAPASQADYTAAGILCTAQGTGTLTFTCDTTPTNNITVNVVAL